jgi:hypothetical protein
MAILPGEYFHLIIIEIFFKTWHFEEIPGDKNFKPDSYYFMKRAKS